MPPPAVAQPGRIGGDSTERGPQPGGEIADGVGHERLHFPLLVLQASINDVYVNVKKCGSTISSGHAQSAWWRISLSRMAVAFSRLW